MTLPQLTHSELIDHLEKKGCIEFIPPFHVTGVFVMEKGDVQLPIIRESKYWFFTVCEICDGLNVVAPKDCKKVYDQTFPKKKKDTGKKK